MSTVSLGGGEEVGDKRFGILWLETGGSQKAMGLEHGLGIEEDYWGRRFLLSEIQQTANECLLVTT